MDREIDNPFSVTKATEFSDIEINEYWVNFNTKDDISINAILNPSEYLPKYVIGGKGCGKTHILRYFSYPLQKIRNGGVLSLINNEKYIGLYSIFHGINSSRFIGKGIDEDQWNSIFEYYFELYICDNLLCCLKDLIFHVDPDKETERELVSKILSLFSETQKLPEYSDLDQVSIFLTDLRSKIDMQILNAAFTRKLEYEEVRVLFSPGDLIFGIPKVFSEHYNLFNETKFIYIFDEYEKLFEWQKKFINTLVWDKRNPVTFWIGARRHGFTTRETKSGQEMKSGSEFQDVNLDNLIRNNESLYKEFAEKLFTDRLVKYYRNFNLKYESNDIKKRFQDKFEKYDEIKILNDIKDRKAKSKRDYFHIQDLRKKLETAKSPNFKNVNEIETVINSITKLTNDDPLHQKYKLFYFYKLWNKAKVGETVESHLDIINCDYGKFIRGEKSYFDEIVDKRKKDFIAQLAKQNDIKNTEYSGIDRFIELSQGNARHFILILKKAVEYSRIKGEKPLDDGGKISLESQYLAVYDTAKWFYEDIEVTGEGGKRLYNSLKNLADYFVQERFCDKPIETTASCFYIKADDLSSNASDIIELMKMHSVLIENDEGRLDKNTGRKERLFQLNKILAPLWQLPTVVRGSISLNRDFAEAIFNFEQHPRFQQLYLKRRNQLNAPHFLKGGKLSSETLF